MEMVRSPSTHLKEVVSRRMVGIKHLQLLISST